MKKLFFAEFKRCFLSIPYLICSGIILVENAYYILFNQYGTRIDVYLFDQLQPPTPLLFPQYIYLFVSLIPIFHVGSEFAYRTINNKISMGYTKTQIFLCEVFVCSIISFLFLCEDTILSLVFCHLKHYSITVIFSFKFVITFFTVACIFTTISSLSTFISFLIRDRIVSLFVVLALSLALSYLGNNDVSSILQEKYYLSPSENSEEIELLENPLYLQGISRKICNLRIALSPYAQNAYSSYFLAETTSQKRDNSFIFSQCDIHIEFIITDILLCVITIYLGIKIFKKMNLK